MCLILFPCLQGIVFHSLIKVEYKMWQYGVLVSSPPRGPIGVLFSETNI